MKYFTIRKRFLSLFFDLEAKEEEKIEKFLQFLEDSGVGSVINKYALKRPKFKASPYELTVNLLGEEIVKKLGVEFVDPNDITFSPKFFK